MRDGSCNSFVWSQFSQLLPDHPITVRSLNLWPSNLNSARMVNSNQTGGLPLLLYCSILSLNRVSNDNIQAIEAPPEPVPEPEAPVQARPGWRVVHKRPERKPARTVPKITGAPTPVPQALPELPKPIQDVPAWAQWRRMTLIPAWCGNTLLIFVVLQPILFWHRHQFRRRRWSTVHPPGLGSLVSLS